MGRSARGKPRAGEKKAAALEEEIEKAPSQPLVSYIDRLKGANVSPLERDRKVAKKAPPKGTKSRTSPAATPTEPKNISAKQRVAEHPNESLYAESTLTLRCGACKEYVSRNGTTLANHLQSQKHKTALSKFSEDKHKAQDISERLKQWDADHPDDAGQGVPERTRLFRLDMVKAFMEAGIPLHKLDQVRNKLEKWSTEKLTASTHLKGNIPFLRKEELDHVRTVVGTNDFSFEFDGTPRCGEVIAVVLRVVDDELNILQILARVRIYEDSLDHEQIAQALIETIVGDLGTQRGQVIAAMRDRVAANTAALRIVKAVLGRQVFDSECWCHTANHVGENFATPNLDKFFKAWVKAVSKSVNVRRRYKLKFGDSPKRHKDIRWWSKWEVLEQLMREMAEIPTFVLDLHGAGLVPKCASKMLQIINDPDAWRKLKLELAATVDAGKEFVLFTYDMEGDGPLAFAVHARLVRLDAFVSAPTFPNLEALARHLGAAVPGAPQQLFDYGVACVVAGFAYWRQKVVELGKQAAAFKGAFAFDPNAARDMSGPTLSAFLRDVKNFDFVTDQNVQDLLGEQAAYVAACAHLPTAADRADDGSSGIDLRAFWRGKREQLPNMYAMVRKIMLVQPSSAACERVFSLLTSTFNPQQDQALADYIEVSLMLQYNHKPSK